jgi:hypothetical protein
MENWLVVCRDSSCHEALAASNPLTFGLSRFILKCWLGPMRNSERTSSLNNERRSTTRGSLARPRGR